MEDEIRNVLGAEIQVRKELLRITNLLRSYPQEFDPIRVDNILYALIHRGTQPAQLETVLTQLREEDGLPVEQEWDDDGRRPYQLMWYRLKYINAHLAEFQEMMRQNQPGSQLLGKLYFSLMMERRGSIEEDALHVAYDYSLLGMKGLILILNMFNDMNQRGQLERGERQRELAEMIPEYIRILEEHQDDHFWNTEPMAEESMIWEILLFRMFFAKNVRDVITSMKRHQVPAGLLREAVQDVKAFAQDRHLDFLMEDVEAAERLVEQEGGRRTRRGPKGRSTRRGPKARNTRGCL